MRDCAKMFPERGFEFLFDTQRCLRSRRGGHDEVAAEGLVEKKECRCSMAPAVSFEEVISRGGIPEQLDDENSVVEMGPNKCGGAGRSWKMQVTARAMDGSRYDVAFRGYLPLIFS